MKYVKLDVSKSHISLIFINSFACWCCKWSLLSLLENIKWGMIIIAATSLRLDLLESWSWESLHFLLEFTLHIHRKWAQSILFHGHQQNCGGWKWDNHLLSLHHTLLAGGQDPGYGISCTRVTPREVLGGNNSFPAPPFFFARSKPRQEEAHTFDMAIMTNTEPYYRIEQIFSKFNMN